MNVGGQGGGRGITRRSADKLAEAAKEQAAGKMGFENAKGHIYKTALKDSSESTFSLLAARIGLQTAGAKAMASAYQNKVAEFVAKELKTTAPEKFSELKKRAGAQISDKAAVMEMMKKDPDLMAKITHMKPISNIDINKLIASGPKESTGEIGFKAKGSYTFKTTWKESGVSSFSHLAARIGLKTAGAKAITSDYKDKVASFVADELKTTALKEFPKLAKREGAQIPDKAAVMKMMDDHPDIMEKITHMKPVSKHDINKLIDSGSEKFVDPKREAAFDLMIMHIDKIVGKENQNTLIGESGEMEVANREYAGAMDRLLNSLEGTPEYDTLLNSPEALANNVARQLAAEKVADKLAEMTKEGSRTVEGMHNLDELLLEHMNIDTDTIDRKSLSTALKASMDRHEGSYKPKDILTKALGKNESLDTIVKLVTETNSPTETKVSKDLPGGDTIGGNIQAIASQTEDLSVTEQREKAERTPKCLTAGTKASDALLALGTPEEINARIETIQGVFKEEAIGAYIDNSERLAFKARKSDSEDLNTVLQELTNELGLLESLQSLYALGATQEDVKALAYSVMEAEQDPNITQKNQQSPNVLAFFNDQTITNDNLFTITSKMLAQVGAGTAGMGTAFSELIPLHRESFRDAQALSNLNAVASGDVPQITAEDVAAASKTTYKDVFTPLSDALKLLNAEGFATDTEAQGKALTLLKTAEETLKSMRSPDEDTREAIDGAIRSLQIEVGFEQEGGIPETAVEDIKESVLDASEKAGTLMRGEQRAAVQIQPSAKERLTFKQAAAITGGVLAAPFRAVASFIGNTFIAPLTEPKPKPITSRNAKASKPKKSLKALLTKNAGLANNSNVKNFVTIAAKKLVTDLNANYAKRRDSGDMKFPGLDLNSANVEVLGKEIHKILKRDSKLLKKVISGDFDETNIKQVADAFGNSVTASNKDFISTATAGMFGSEQYRSQFEWSDELHAADFGIRKFSGSEDIRTVQSAFNAFVARKKREVAENPTYKENLELTNTILSSEDNQSLPHLESLKQDFLSSSQYIGTGVLENSISTARTEGSKKALRKAFESEIESNTSIQLDPSVKEQMINTIKSTPLEQLTGEEQIEGISTGYKILLQTLASQQEVITAMESGADQAESQIKADRAKHIPTQYNNFITQILFAVHYAKNDAGMRSQLPESLHGISRGELKEMFPKPQ